MPLLFTKGDSDLKTRLPALRGGCCLNKPHFNEESRWEFLPTAVSIGAAQNQTFFRTSDGDKTIPSFLFHLGARIALLPALIRRQYVLSETDQINRIKFP